MTPNQWHDMPRTLATTSTKLFSVGTWTMRGHATHLATFVRETSEEAKPTRKEWALKAVECAESGQWEPVCRLRLLGLLLLENADFELGEHDHVFAGNPAIRLHLGNLFDLLKMLPQDRFEMAVVSLEEGELGPGSAAGPSLLLLRVAPDRFVCLAAARPVRDAIADLSLLKMRARCAP